jgi:hypothetical protein
MQENVAIEASCHTCSLRQRAEKKPKSLIARFWRGWKSPKCDPATASNNRTVASFLFYGLASYHILFLARSEKSPLFESIGER